MRARSTRFASLPALSTTPAGADRHARAGVTRRAIGDRARARIQVVERAARRGRSADVDVRRPRSMSSCAPPPTGRPIAPGACSPCIRASRPPPCRRRWCWVTPRASRRDCENGPSSPPRQVATTVGAAALRLPHVPASRRTTADGWATGDRAPADRARRQPERGVSLELASRAAAHGAVGRAHHDGPHAARARRCSKPARTRPTA